MNKLLTLSILLTATTASAESLEEKKFWESPEKNMAAAIKKAGKACKTEFTFEFVDKPKLREEAAKAKHSPVGICENSVMLVLKLCNEGEDEKKTVAEKIKGFQCGYANPRTLELKGGTLIYMGNNVEKNFTPWAKAALTKQL